MDFIKLDFPTNIQEGELHGLLTLLNAIKGETVPMEGHSDPGAITDCWNTAMEICEKVRNIANSSIGDVLKERMDQYDKHPYSLEYDFQNNKAGELMQAAIAVASNNPYLMPSSWKDKSIINKVFKKELYGRLTVACAFLIAQMDMIRIQKARLAGAPVFINGVNAESLIRQPNEPIGTERHCQACNKKTRQVVKLYNPSVPEDGEVWECAECGESIDFV